MLSRVHRRVYSFRTRSFSLFQNPTESHEKSSSTSSSPFRLVIVGTGWAGYKLLKQAKTLTNPPQVVVISERNHFLYTPLLASTTVGTLEFRSIVETVRIGSHHFRDESHFHLASVTNIDLTKKTLTCSNVLEDRAYSVPYDAVVFACGARPNSFGVKGVEEYAFFLKEIWDARAIRTKILENFERASQPGKTDQEKKQLLNFMVVGGGPTGVEFCAELYDFVSQDLSRIYPKASEFVQVSLLESRGILSMFDQSLRDFAQKKLESRPKMKIIQQNCTQVDSTCVTLGDGSQIPCGMVVWSAGVGAAPLTKALPFKKAKNGNLLTNGFCQVQLPDSETNNLKLAANVYAIGDCAEIEGYPLPATAQVAQTQAEYLCHVFDTSKSKEITPYAFQSKGLMAYLGSYEGLVQYKQTRLAGLRSWFIWRSAYLTKLGSWRLRMQVPIDWLKTMIVGRDVSRF